MVKDWANDIELTKSKLKSILNDIKDKPYTRVYTEMCNIFKASDSNLAYGVFSLFADEDTQRIDIRKVLLALGCVVIASIEELLLFEFLILDQDNIGCLSDDDLVVMLQANHFLNNPNEVRAKVRSILTHPEKVI